MNAIEQTEDLGTRMVAVCQDTGYSCGVILSALSTLLVAFLDDPTNKPGQPLHVVQLRDDLDKFAHGMIKGGMDSPEIDH